MRNRFSILAMALALSGTLVLAQGGRSPEALFKTAQHTEEVQGDLKAAIEQYKKVVTAGNRVLAAQALLRMAECHQKLGDAESRKIYEQLVRDFGDQNDAVATARTRLAALLPASEAAAKITRQVWAGHGVDGNGAPSPDGRYLSFTDWDTGDLAVRDLVTGTNRRLSNTGGWTASGDYAQESVVSPDGRQVVYGWFIEKEFKNELRVMPIEGTTQGAPRTILRTERPDYVRPVAWTPDGTHIVVLRSLLDKNNQIGTMSVQDGSYRSIKSLEWRYPDKISLSPDGRFLAYDVPAAENGSPRDIVLLATDGSREVPLVQGPANDASPVWSPDGSRVLFLSDRTGSTSLWSVSIEGGRPLAPAALVKGDIGKVFLLGVAQRGTLYYYLPGSVRRNVYLADIDAAGVAKAPVLVSENFVNSNSGPAWSRDGQYLAYYSQRDRLVLVVKTAATGEERVISLPANVTGPFFSGPRWFPDNRSVLVAAREPQGVGMGFYRLFLETGKTEALWHGNNPSFGSFDLSPDGRSIFCTIQNNGEPKDSPIGTGRLLRYDIDEHREVELKKNEWFITLAVSPDGKELAYLKSIRENTTEYASAIDVIPTSGGASRQVFRHPIWFDASRYNALAWTPDSQSILFVRGEGRLESILWRVPRSGGAPEKVGITSPARIKSPSVHPDGKRIAFGMGENDDNELWTLENFLPKLAARK